MKRLITVILFLSWHCFWPMHLRAQASTSEPIIVLPQANVTTKQPVSVAAAPQTSPVPAASFEVLPKDFAGCGATYNGQQFGYACDYAWQMTATTYGWLDNDAHPFHKGEASTTSAGVATKLGSVKLGNVAIAYLMNITTAGATTTVAPSGSSNTLAIGSSFALPILFKSGFSVTPVVRGTTGAAKGWEVRIMGAFSWN